VLFRSAIARARAGDGPTLIEVETYRLAGHFMGDAEQYRPAGEKDALFAKDPIPKMRARLMADGHATEGEIVGLEKRADERVADAIAFARESKPAADTDALTAVFA
jgi:pyruvate dehydrogenase E1 component alpha subunit